MAHFTTRISVLAPVNSRRSQRQWLRHARLLHLRACRHPRQQFGCACLKKLAGPSLARRRPSATSTIAPPRTA